MALTYLNSQMIEVPLSVPTLSARSIQSPSINSDSIITQSLTSSSITVNDTYLQNGGRIFNNALLFGNLTVTGTISALSGFNAISTTYSNTTALSVVNTGIGPAVSIVQSTNTNGIMSVIGGDNTEIFRINNTTTNQGLPIVRILNSGTGNTITAGNSQVNSSAFVLTSAGFVGIGATSPSFELDVRDTSNTTIHIMGTTSGVRGGMSVDTPVTGAFYTGSYASQPLVLGTNNAERIRVTVNGNVGIGTSSPGARLDIKGLARSSIGTGTGAGGAGYAFYQFGTSATNTENWHIGAEGDGSFRFYNQGLGAGLERMRIDSSGNVGIGTSSPTFRLQLGTDSAAKPSTNTWTIASDERIKENIRPYTKGLEAIAEINPVVYDYNGKAGFDKIKDNIGVIAQDVKDVVPEGVSTYKAKLNNDDTEDTELYNFNSHPLTYILLNSVKELKAIIDNQNTLIESLNQRVVDLELGN